MLGISLSDSVLVGTLIVSVLVAWTGAKTGEVTKRKDPALAASSNTWADVELLANAISQCTAATLALKVVLEDEARRHQIEQMAERQLEMRDLLEFVREIRSRRQ